eukprot:4345342-Pyramimonas_sp.AAC.1
MQQRAQEQHVLVSQARRCNPQLACNPYLALPHVHACPRISARNHWQRCWTSYNVHGFFMQFPDLSLFPRAHPCNAVLCNPISLMGAFA